MAKIQTVTEQVYHNIFRSIADGTYGQGTKLTLKTLQEELGVSSSPIREALTRLRVYAGAEHKHAAQKPEEWAF